MPTTRAPIVAGTLVAGAVAIASLGLLASDDDAPPADFAPNLAQLQVAPDNQAVPYNRAAGFGDGWEARNGCPGGDTRDEVLARDLIDETTARGGCDVLSGTLESDPYTGEHSTGPTKRLDIDHVVPLAEAWRAGAWAWSFDQRVAFANDLENLQATALRENRVKGDSGPDEWLPAHRPCTYAGLHLRILVTRGLTATPERKAAIEKACDQ